MTRNISNHKFPERKNHTVNSKYAAHGSSLCTIELCNICPPQELSLNNVQSLLMTRAVYSLLMTACTVSGSRQVLYIVCRWQELYSPCSWQAVSSLPMTRSVQSLVHDKNCIYSCQWQDLYGLPMTRSVVSANNESCTQSRCHTSSCLHFVNKLELVSNIQYKN